MNRKILKTKKSNKIFKLNFINYRISSNRRFIDTMILIYGVGYFFASQVCRMCGFSLNYKIGQIKKRILLYVSDFFLSYVLVERGLRRFRHGLLMQRKNSGCIRGVRLLQGLPINGQRTHTNSKTVRRLFKFYKYFERS